MNLFGQLLQEQFNTPHHYCVDHVLELTTELAFKDANLPGCQGTMQAARALVGHFKHSSIAAELLRKTQAILGITTPLRLFEDVATRWWSTYKMIERLIKLKPSIEYVQSHNAFSKTLHLSEQQWKVNYIIYTIPV